MVYLVFEGLRVHFETKGGQKLFLRALLYGLGYPRQLFPGGNFIERLYDCENVDPVGRVKADFA